MCARLVRGRRRVCKFCRRRKKGTGTTSNSRRWEERGGKKGNKTFLPAPAKFALQKLEGKKKRRRKEVGRGGGSRKDTMGRKRLLKKKMQQSLLPPSTSTIPFALPSLEKQEIRSTLTRNHYRCSVRPTFPLLPSFPNSRAPPTIPQPQKY